MFADVYLSIKVLRPNVSECLLCTSRKTYLPGHKNISSGSEGLAHPFQEWRCAHESGSTFSTRINNATSSPTSVIYNNGPLVQYYRRQAGRGRKDIGSIYSTPPFVQRGHGLGRVLSGLFRTLRPICWSGAKSMGKGTLKALGREALRIGGMILTDIAENPQAETKDIISRHVSDSTQKIISCVEVALASERAMSLTRNAKRKRKTKRTLPGEGRQRARTIKRNIFHNLHQSRYDHVSEGPSFHE